MQPKICIGIANGGTIKTQTIACLIDLLSQSPYEKNIMMPIGGYPQISRNMIIQKAISEGATHVLFIDNDMIFPPDGLTKFISLDKPVIGANYNERRMPLRSTIKLADQDGNLISKSAEDMPNEPFKVHTVGCGFCLIKTEVFGKIDPPYMGVFMDGGDVTEDYYMCQKFWKAGVEVWCDPNLKAGHIGDYIY